MRDSGPIRKRLIGTADIALQYVNEARDVLGQLKARLGSVKFGIARKILDNGVIVTARAIIGGLSIVEIDITKAAFCKPIESRLSGFVYDTNGVQGLVLTPTPVHSAPYKYSLRLYQASSKPLPDTKYLGTYDRAITDTCGNTELRYTSPATAGNIDWRGPRSGDANKNFVLSWFGIPSRYIDGVYWAWGSHSLFGVIGKDFYNLQLLGPDELWQRYKNNGIFCMGKQVMKQTITSGIITKSPLTDDMRIGGACLVKAPTGEEYLVYVGSDVGLPAGYSLPSYQQDDLSSVGQEKVYSARVISKDTELLVQPPVLVNTFNWTLPAATAPQQFNARWAVPLGCNLASWFFNASGTRAVTNRTVGESLKRHFMDIVATSSGVTCSVTPDSAAYSAAFYPAYNIVAEPGQAGTCDITMLFSDYVGDSLVECHYTHHADCSNVFAGPTDDSVSGIVNNTSILMSSIPASPAVANRDVPSADTTITLTSQISASQVHGTGAVTATGIPILVGFTAIDLRDQIFGLLGYSDTLTLAHVVYKAGQVLNTTSFNLSFSTGPFIPDIQRMMSSTLQWFRYRRADGWANPYMAYNGGNSLGYKNADSFSVVGEGLPSGFMNGYAAAAQGFMRRWAVDEGAVLFDFGLGHVFTNRFTGGNESGLMVSTSDGVHQVNFLTDGSIHTLTGSPTVTSISIDNVGVV